MAVFHNRGAEKSSVKIMLPMPGFCSGVGTWVDKVRGVGVAEGGNQTTVGEGSGVPVATDCSMRDVSATLAQLVRPAMSPIRANNLKKINLVFDGEKIIFY